MVLTGADEADRPLRELLQLSGVPGQQQGRVSRTLRRVRRLVGRVLGRAVRAIRSFPRRTSRPLLFALQLGLLTRNDLPLIRAGARARDEILTNLVRAEPRRVARARSSRRTTRRGPLPDDLPGDTDAERITAYATTGASISCRTRCQWRTCAGAWRTIRSLSTEQQRDQTAFLNAAPAFNLFATHVDSFLAANPNALAGRRRARGASRSI